MPPGLVRAESDLGEASFVLGCTVVEIVEAHLIDTPGVRQDRISGGMVMDKVLGEADLARVANFQKTHGTKK